MKLSIKALVIAAIAAVSLFAVTPMASAQGGPPGGGRMGGMMRGGGSLMYLRRNDVQKDLKITDDQKTKLTELQTKMRSDMMAMFQGGGGGQSDEDRQAMQKKMGEMMADAQKQADAILTADQKTRLEQISVQMQGNRIAMDEKYQTKLKMTDDQKSKLKDLQTKQQEAMQSLFEKMRNGEIEREEMQASMKKNNDVMDTEVGKILTADQKKMLADWSGPKFDRDPAEDNQRGFGGGGGR